MRKRFTVVTPNLNNGRYIAETIESVLEVLGPNDEYFVVDGMSTDESVSVIQRYENRLTHWISEKDRSYSEAIDKGFRLGSGIYQCWINSGDLLLKGALDEAAVTIDKTAAELIFGDDVYIDEKCRVIFYSRGYVSDLRKYMLYGGWTPLQDACFWRRSLYERIGGLDINVRNAADYDLFLRMSQAGKSLYVSRVFSAFRRQKDQRSIRFSECYSKERAQCRRAALNKYAAPWFKHKIHSALYAILVRFRAHVQAPAWRLPRLQSCPVSSLNCRNYWKELRTME